jgi:hypothetical protein
MHDLELLLQRQRSDFQSAVEQLFQANLTSYNKQVDQKMASLETTLATGLNTVNEKLTTTQQHLQCQIDDLKKVVTCETRSTASSATANSPQNVLHQVTAVKSPTTPRSGPGVPLWQRPEILELRGFNFNTQAARIRKEAWRIFNEHQCFDASSILEVRTPFSKGSKAQIRCRDAFAAEDLLAAWRKWSDEHPCAFRTEHREALYLATIRPPHIAARNGYFWAVRCWLVEHLGEDLGSDVDVCFRSYTMRSTSKEVTLIKLPYGQTVCQIQWDAIQTAFGAEAKVKLEAWKATVPEPRPPRLAVE